MGFPGTVTALVVSSPVWLLRVSISQEAISVVRYSNMKGQWLLSDRNEMHDREGFPSDTTTVSLSHPALHVKRVVGGTGENCRGVFLVRRSRNASCNPSSWHSYEGRRIYVVDIQPWPTSDLPEYSVLGSLQLVGRRISQATRPLPMVTIPYMD